MSMYFLVLDHPLKKTLFKNDTLFDVNSLETTVNIHSLQPLTDKESEPSYTTCRNTRHWRQMISQLQFL